MNKYKYFLIFVVVSAIFSIKGNVLYAQDSVVAEQQQYAGEPPSEGARIVSKMKFKPLEFVPPKVERIVIENGMIIYLLEDHSLPLFHIGAVIKTGSVYDPPDKLGLASLAGNVLRSGGTTSMASDKINEELEYIAASIETNISRESGNVSLSTLKKDIDKGLKIFADILMNPAFEEDKIKKRKDEIIESIRRENDVPGAIVYREFRKLIYDDKHPYSRKIEGEIETIKNITRDDIIAFYKQYFCPNNIIMGISGDFKKDEIISKIKAVFGDWQKKEVNFPEIKRVEKNLEESVNYIFKEINQSNIVLGHLGIERTNKDYFPVMLMNFVLGGGSLKARIPDKVRGERGLAYSVHSDFHTQRDLGFFYVSCQTKSESTIEAISLILEEIRRIRDEPISDEELTRGRDTIINQFIFRFTDSASIVSQIVDIEYEGLPPDYLDTYVENIRSITKADIQRAAKEYLHPEKMEMLIIGDEAQFDMPLKELGTVSVIELKKY